MTFRLKTTLCMVCLLSLLFGGGGGAGVKVTPVCFLVVNGTSVKVLAVDAAPETSLDRVVDMIPDVVNKITGLMEEKKAKKQEAEG